MRRLHKKRRPRTRSRETGVKKGVGLKRNIMTPANVVTSESRSRYSLLRKLGHGGMGEVWLAERTSSAGHVQKVAVKTFAGKGSAGSLAVEALRISKLSHDNIVQFVDSWRDESGRLFVAMSYVDGIDLNGLRDISGLTWEAASRGQAEMRIPSQIVGYIVLMALRALHHAHTFDFGDGSIGLVHRDVSPGNLLIGTDRGSVKLTDFGITSESGSGAGENGTVPGNVVYMSPEALVGDQLDDRTDIYSLGLIAYELLTGFNPNVGPRHMSSLVGSITNIMMAVEKPLRPPHEVVQGTDVGLSMIIFKMLASRIGDRYDSAEAVIEEIVPCLYERGVGPTSESLTGYLKLLEGRQSEVEVAERLALSFLSSGPAEDWREDLRWTLTPEAEEHVSACRNPSRIGAD